MWWDRREGGTDCEIVSEMDIKDKDSRGRARGSAADLVCPAGGR